MQRNDYCQFQKKQHRHSLQLCLSVNEDNNMLDKVISSVIYSKLACYGEIMKYTVTWVTEINKLDSQLSLN